MFVGRAHACQDRRPGVFRGLDPAPVGEWLVVLEVAELRVGGAGERRGGDLLGGELAPCVRVPGAVDGEGSSGGRVRRAAGTGHRPLGRAAGGEPDPSGRSSRCLLAVESWRATCRVRLGRRCRRSAETLPFGARFLRGCSSQRALVLVGRDDGDRRVVLTVAVARVHGGVAEEGGELVEVLLADRVELVVVAGGAPSGKAVPHRHGGFDPVGGVDDLVFRRDEAAFRGGRIAAVEAGGDPLFEGRFRQQVAGELLDGELVEGHVGIEGVDHPVAVRPDRAVVVEVEAVGVGIAGGI